MMQSIRSLVVLLGLAVLGLAQAAPPGTEAYGLYLKTGEDYIPARSLPNIPYLNHDFTAHMFDFPVANRGNETVELLVHYPEFHPGRFTLEARPIALAGARAPIPVNIAPLGEDRFRVTSTEAVPDTHLLVADLSCCVQGVHGIALGEPAAVLLEAYAAERDLNPVRAEHTLGKALRGQAQNTQLQALHAHWRTRVAQAKASEHYAFIESVQQQYERAEGPEQRYKKLRHLRSVSEQYLKNHPQGLERAQVQKLLDTVNDKLNV
ncbi:hypothetical protein [Alkalilimnicola sp. S0819]|uniref:hypothetical protein n=1 Tax=Alkalilimnicola sp. S0819 TaxID=2613922 RepID=UPI00126169D1|nr:hypothetical protein [Alkalilimnicola sp. S0819]KAB7623922.1 hypothetical protein F3N43_07700 [Alkalilimnicola sp. S0819]MPQ16519.1 hypothetical protein [Alkalilimnicola sp. S0819]